MTYLSEILQSAYLRLGQISYYTASDGSTTTLVDTSTGITDSSLTGTIFIEHTTDDAAPIYEWGKVSTFASNTGTFTIATALTAAVEAGDRFGYATPLYTLDQMINLTNQALREHGTLDYVDKTTLDSLSDTTEYDQELIWKYSPERIDIQGKTNNSVDNNWIELADWTWEPAAPGVKGKIIFKNGSLQSGRDLRIWYRRLHPKVNDYNDVIHEYIHPEVLACTVAMKAVKWLLTRTQGENSFLMQEYNSLQEELQQLKIDNATLRKNTKQKTFNMS